MSAARVLGEDREMVTVVFLWLFIVDDCIEHKQNLC